MMDNGRIQKELKELADGVKNVCKLHLASDHQIIRYGAKCFNAYIYDKDIAKTFFLS